MSKSFIIDKVEEENKLIHAGQEVIPTILRWVFLPSEIKTGPIRSVKAPWN
jgi:hypothetical protein